MVINPIVGVYIPIIRIPIKGGMTIPNIATFDHGTYRNIKDRARLLPIGGWSAFCVFQALVSLGAFGGDQPPPDN